MSQTIIGKTRLALPITKDVGSQHQPPAVAGGEAPPQVAVPGPSQMVINGRTIIIDVRKMQPVDVLGLLNTCPGVTANLDTQNRLTVSGIDTILGDGNLRVILGI